MTTKLVDFWPDAEKCSDCLFTEAEAADEAVFLAAHQPMKIVRAFRSSSSRTEETVSEAAVLKSLLTSRPPSGTLVLPVTGTSGVGKSHLIRWLDANLRLRKDRESRHVVRIPKSSSLRGVLELILTGLPESYKPIREQLTNARLPDSLSTATLTLNLHLRIELENLGQIAMQRIQNGEKLDDDQSRVAHCSEQNLIALLKDPAISANFDATGESPGVIARIAQRFLSGKKQQVDVSEYYFQERDLDFLENQTTANLAHVTRRYAQLLRNTDRRREAIGCLNEVVDKALGKLVEMGGRSLTDIFVELRKQLFADGIELVLLVEDFAVLAGIQGPLLDAMIREAIRDGQQELCVMRTALAVTSGMLPETIMTRAQAEWRIDSKPFENEEEAIDSYCDFVGGYLNAARLGKDRLRAAYEKRPQGTSNEDWIPSYYSLFGERMDDAEKARLEKFGTSKRGNYPLFPLNREAISQLAELTLKEGTNFRFDPRGIMNRIIRETVVSHRAMFLRKEFPPAGFAGFNPGLLATAVSTRMGEHAERLSAFVYFWGGSPQTPGQAAAIPIEIYQAFGAAEVDWKAEPEGRRKTLPARQAEGAEQGQPSQDELDGKWGKVLADWRATRTIGQQNAAQLRTMLVEGIQSWLDWDAMLLHDHTLSGTNIWLPKATVGNPTSSDKVMAFAAEDSALEDIHSSNEFFAAMTAVVRYDKQKSWNYPDGETDSASYANLISRMANQTQKWLAKQGPHLRPELLVPVSRALLVDARILNLHGATSNSDVDNIQALLTQATGPGNHQDDDPWSKLVTSASAERSAMLEGVLRQIAARQGSGEPQAVDATVLLAALRKTRSSWSLSDLDSALIAQAPPRVREPLNRLKRNLQRVVKKRQSEISEWRVLILDSFGEQFELGEVQRQFLDTIRKAKECGVFRLHDLQYDSLQRKIKDLRGVSEALSLAGRVVQKEEFGVTLSALTQIDPATVRKTEELVGYYNQFLDETCTEVDERLKDAPPSPDQVGKHLLDSLDQAETQWTEILKDADS